MDQKLIDRLSDRIDDDELIALMEVAEGSEDPDSVLRSALDGDMPQPKRAELKIEGAESNGHSTSGISVVECRYTVLETSEKTGAEHEVERFRGWCLASDTGSKVRYCGSDIAWCIRLAHVHSPFETEAEAENACGIQSALTAIVLDKSLRPISPDIYVVRPVESLKPKKLQRQLTERQQIALDCVTRAGRMMNFETESGKVSTDADGIALILEAIASKIGI